MLKNPSTGLPTVFQTDVQEGAAPIIVSQSGGDDTVAKRWGIAFKTLTAAKAAAKKGDTIDVLDGTFNENDLWKGSVTWSFRGGSGVSYTDAGGNGRGLFDDQSDPGTTCIVYGLGALFRHIQADNGNIKGAFVLTNASSVLHVNARRIEVGEGTLDNVAAITIEDGRCFARVSEVIDVSADPSSNGTRSSGVYFKNGYGIIHIDYSETGGYAVYAKEAAGTPTASLTCTGRHWKNATGSTVQSIILTDPNAVGTPNLNFTVIIEVNKIEAIGGIYVVVVGAFRITSDEHIAAGNVAHEHDRGVEAYLYVKRTRSLSSSGIAGFWSMPTFTGKVVGTVLEYLQESTNPVILLDGTGSVSMSGSYMRAANGKGIQSTGAGTYRIKGYRIDTTPTNNAANVPVNLGNSTTGLVLEQCILLAPATADSVEAAVARTIASYGSVANKAADANVTIAAGGSLTVNAAVV